MAEPGTGRGKTAGLILPPRLDWFLSLPNKTRIQAKGTEKHQRVATPNPRLGSFLKVLGGTSAERRCTGGLSRSGASPYQCIEDEDDDEYEGDQAFSLLPRRSA
jgi:hypothetical protein